MRRKHQISRSANLGESSDNARLLPPILCLMQPKRTDESLSNKRAPSSDDRSSASNEEECFQQDPNSALPNPSRKTRAVNKCVNRFYFGASPVSSSKFVFQTSFIGEGAALRFLETLSWIRSDLSSASLALRTSAACGHNRFGRHEHLSHASIALSQSSRSLDFMLNPYKVGLVCRARCVNPSIPRW